MAVQVDLRSLENEENEEGGDRKRAGGGDKFNSYGESGECNDGGLNRSAIGVKAFVHRHSNNSFDLKNTARPLRHSYLACKSTIEQALPTALA
nr:hypothetical protein Itr_chr01CG04920 [Ipomoea trifida]